MLKKLKGKFRHWARGDHNEERKSRTKANIATATASAHGPASLDRPSTSGLPPVHTTEAPIRELWDLAYINLRREDEGLVVEYENKLCGDLTAGLAIGPNVSIRERMDTILRRKMEKVNEDAWKLKFGTSEVQVRDLVQPILGVVERANGFIKAAVSANPSASLAWAGVSVLLPVSLVFIEQQRYQGTQPKVMRVVFKIRVCDIWRDIKYDEECSAAAHRHREAIGHWQDIGMGISGLQEAVREAQRENHRREMISWLCGVDPSRIYNVARGKHQSGTGDWLLEGEKFQSWQKSPKSLLWLHGKPGCGKSVLSSSVIKQLQKEHSSNPGSPVAYFFFSFSDRETQKVEAMLSSLIGQLYASRPDTPQVIKDLDTYKEKRQSPDMETLENALIDIANGFSSVSLIIDALDECPSINEERRNLLESLRRIVAKMPDNLHIFLTSRPESEIRTEMDDTFAKRQDSFSCAMNLTSGPEGVNRDIGLYIDSTLASGTFKLWPPNLKAKAKDILVKRADGMFQYAVCQFDVLKKYHSTAEIYEALEKLPQGLNETYDRILKNIDKEFLAQSIILLKWLVASVWPLSIEELSEACIFRPERDLPFDAKYRQFGPQECIMHISSLTVQYEGFNNNTSKHDSKKVTYIHLAHFSVEEYLTSNSSVDSEIAAFFFTKIDAHLLVAHSSLIYHLYRSTLRDEEVIDLPLLEYAQENWMSHLEIAPRESWPNDLVRLAARALTPGSKSVFLMIRRNYKRATDGWGRPDRNFDSMIKQPLYWVARLGSLKLTEMLLPGSPWANKYLGQRDLNAALEEAAFKGGVKIIQLLLDRGAHVNAASKIVGGALHAAVLAGNVATVNLLLDNDADVNAQHSYFGTVLRTAVSGGDIHLVKLLVSRGADVHLPLNKGESILALAVEKHGSIELLQYLLDSGADINGQDRTGVTALYEASDQLANAHFRLLLERGADVNVQGGKYGNALQAACRCNALELVQLLLARGVDVNAQGGFYGNALQAAVNSASNRDLSVVKLLLDKGADVNAQGGEYGNALLAACMKGALKIIKLLLNRGADVNAQGSKFGSALQAACFKGHLEVIELLLTREADVDGSGGRFGTPLQAAASPYYSWTTIEKILELQGGYYGSAWHAAAAAAASIYNRHAELGNINLVLKLLTTHGAHVNGIQGRVHATALQATLEFKSATSDTNFLEKVECSLVGRVRFLLDHGANVNIQAGKYGFPLQSACANKIGTRRAMYLLQHCPDLDINAAGGIFGSALQAAACSGQADTVKLLLEKGADPNARGGKYRSALDAAILGGFWYIVEMLLDHGAISDRQRLLSPDEEWLDSIQEEGFEDTVPENEYDCMVYWLTPQGPDREKWWEDVRKEETEHAIERYRIFWERQPADQGAT
ncbi:hypothetical protein NPX13_g4955 [Xylaria arbuscula]|uniref:NACHT domain-containing protein n=1 Tax=Xylaria arbuscula TaxID=114810 RepID=A0A9W8NFE1_9PEZI|nr:hypothetical protein NPX13_g4955 [Xylaria arbuscula]